MIQMALKYKCLFLNCEQNQSKLNQTPTQVEKTKLDYTEKYNKLRFLKLISLSKDLNVQSYFIFFEEFNNMIINV